MIRTELCEEAVRLALLLAEQPQTCGTRSAAFLALLLFHAARLEARLDNSGAILLLREQERSRWDRELLDAAFYWLNKATVGDNVTRYHAEAWIAAEHCRAASVDETNWQAVTMGYDLLCKLAPSPVHELNRAIAIGYRDGPEAGLRAFSSIEAGALAKDYYLWHAAHAELSRQAGHLAVALESFQKAWELAPTKAEKELICRKMDNLEHAE